MNRKAKGMCLAGAWLLLFAFTSCSNGVVSSSNTTVSSSIPVVSSSSTSSKLSETNDGEVALNEILPIYDADENHIVDLEHYGDIIQTENGFVYSKRLSNSSDESYIMEYYQYDFRTNESVKLGVIENWVYDAAYDTLCLNDHIYLLVTTGNMYDYDKATHFLYDIDLTEKTMSATELKNASAPYSSMALAGDKIMIMSPGNGKTFISAYEIGSKEIKEISSYDFDSETKTGESIRHISSDGRSIYLLRLKTQTEANVQLYVDMFDLDMNFLSTVEITDAVSRSVLEGADKNNEMRQLVAHFDVNNGYVYYENFSSSRAFFELTGLPDAENAGAEQPHTKRLAEVIREAGPDFYKARSAAAYNTRYLLYDTYNWESNDIYVMDTETEKLEEYTFTAENEKYFITCITQNAQEDLLISVDYFTWDTFETLPPRMYYVNLSDLEKKEA